nr:retrovirus-related Pol polyprotein from transposon TNT 1-94 [Tanacetum cinerariifolium]
MIVDSIDNGPYVRRMIATLGEPDLLVPVPESLHEQTDEELPETDIKRMDADDQAIQTILLGLPEDVYAAVDKKKAKLFNEWENFTSTDGESIELYYHRFMQLMNDLKRNKHFLKNIASNLKFLNNLQPEWKRHVTIFRQTKNLHEADFTQIYDFLKMNQEEVNELRAERLAKSHDPLTLMAHSQNSFSFPTTHIDQSSSSTHPQQSFPINNKCNPQPPLYQNFMQPQMTSLEDINDPTEAMNATLILFAKAFQLSAPTNNNQRTSSNPHNLAQNQQGFNAWQNGGIQGAQNAGVQSGRHQNGLVVVPRIANHSGTGNVVAARAEGTGIRNQAMCYNCKGLSHIARNCTARPRRRDAAYLQTQLLIAQKEEAGIQLQAEEFDFMVAAGDLDEIEEVNANCILMKEQYTDLLEPISEPQLVPQNDNHVTSVTPSMVHSGGLVHTAKTRRPQPKGNTRNARVPSAFKSSEVKKIEPMRKWFSKSTVFLGRLSKFVCGASTRAVRNIKLLINFVWKFLGIVRFGNDHIAAILGYGDLKWRNITITRVYFIEGNRSTNLYTINLYDIASASPICLMARATPTKSWLWHQRLSHLNFDTINDLAKNDLFSGLPKFKYAKEHLCPSCEQGKSKRASHPPKPVPNSKQRLHQLHMDLCGPMQVTSINGKRYVLVIIDDYSQYTWVHFLRTKDETP